MMYKSKLHREKKRNFEALDAIEFLHRVCLHIPDPYEAVIRYYGLYANAHRGKVRKASHVFATLGMIEEKPPLVPSNDWAEMIRKVYEVDPLVCPRRGGGKVVALIDSPLETLF